MRINLLRWCFWITALILLVLPAVVEAQFNFTTNDGALTITGYTGPGGVVVIPDTTNGYPVIGIADFAFEDGTNLTSVSIPGTVTNIGEAPFFGCTSLTNISVNATNQWYISGNGGLINGRNFTLVQYPSGLTNETYTINFLTYPPYGVTNIGPYAFASCASLTSVTYAANGWPAYNIGDFAFSGCTNLTSVTVSNTPGYVTAAPTSIGADAFSNCTSLNNIVFITPVADIGASAFADCTNFMAAYFPGNGSPDIGNAFEGDPEAVVYYIPGTTNWGPTFEGAPTAAQTPPYNFNYAVINGSIAITEYARFVGTVIIPAYINGYPVTSIFEAFFRDNITSVVIPNTVTNIGGSAFYQCLSLTNIVIPNSVTSVGNGAFFGCTRLTSVTIPNSVTSIGSLAFAACVSFTNIVIPDSVTSIGAAAFADCTRLTNISVDAANPSYISLNGVLFDKAQETLLDYPAGLTNSSIYIIPNTVTNIGGYAFSGCTSLTIIAIPNGVTSIGVDAFADCVSLAGITIPNSVTSIGWEAFDACTSLTSVTVPNSITSIGQFAFEDCSSLKSVYFQGNAPPDPGNAFANDPCTVYYLPGTTGWGATFGGAPTVLWNPQATTFTLAGGQFGFNITGPTNATIVVVACTNLANPVWLPVSTITLSTNGTSSFSDPQLGNDPNRYYRFSAP